MAKKMNTKEKIDLIKDMYDLGPKAFFASHRSKHIARLVDSDQAEAWAQFDENQNAYTAPLTAEAERAQEVEKAYREGFQDGAEWARDDSAVGEDFYWDKSKAKAALKTEGVG